MPTYESSSTHRALPGPPLPASSSDLDLAAFTYEERAALLPLLTASIAHAGGWVLRKRRISRTALQLEIELQNRDLDNLYAALVATGIELTRGAHLALAGRCACKRQLPAEARNITAVHLTVDFLAEADPTAFIPFGTA